MSERRDRPRLPLSGYVESVDSSLRVRFVSGELAERGRIVYLGDGTLVAHPDDIERIEQGMSEHQHMSQSYTLDLCDSRYRSDDPALGGSQSEAVDALNATLENGTRHRAAAGRDERRSAYSTSAAASDSVRSWSDAEVHRHRQMAEAERAKRIELERKLKELTRRRGPADGVVGKYERSIEEDDDGEE